MADFSHVISAANPNDALNPVDDLDLVRKLHSICFFTKTYQSKEVEFNKQFGVPYLSSSLVNCSQITPSVLNTVIENELKEELCMVFEMEGKVYAACKSKSIPVNVILMLAVSRLDYTLCKR